jgi:hypothetical protein
VTVASGLAAVALVACLVISAVVTAREARRSGLGLAHPAAVWLALHVVFFGIGGVALALSADVGGQALYTGLAALAVSLGLSGSATLARARRTGDPSGDPFDGPHPLGVAAIDVRTRVAAALAIGSVLLVVPTLLRTGLPFLVTDITGARVEITGLLVQPMRVALPALAVAAVLLAMATARLGGGGEGLPNRRRAVAIAVGVSVAIGLFDLMLASRYFLAELAGAIVLGWLLGGGRIRARVVLVLAIAGVAAFGGVGLLRAWGQAQGHELDFILTRTVNRVLLVQPRTLDAIMTAIPADHPFFAGLGWMRRLEIGRASCRERV